MSLAGLEAGDLIGWVMILLSGLAGSGHCVGMCGPFVITLGAGTTGVLENLRRQFIYGTGRVFTYTVLGAAAGYAGNRLSDGLSPLVEAQAWLAVTAGVTLTGLGLVTLGEWGRLAGQWLRRQLGMRSGIRGCPRIVWSPSAPLHDTTTPLTDGQRKAGTHSDRAQLFGAGFKLAADSFRSLLAQTGDRSCFVAGLVNGFLPCGLVYAFLALAASSGSVWSGGATMALFGLGTVPVLVVTGSAATLLGVAARRRLVRLAAYLVILTGIVTLARGIRFLHSNQLSSPGSLHSQGQFALSGRMNLGIITPGGTGAEQAFV